MTIADVLGYLRTANIHQLEAIYQAVEIRIEQYRASRERPCKWGRCNGTVENNRCSRCGQGYV